VANPQVKGSSQNLSTQGKVGIVPKVVPEAQTDLRKLDAAVAAVAVLHVIVAICCRNVGKEWVMVVDVHDWIGLGLRFDRFFEKGKRP